MSDLASLKRQLNNAEVVLASLEEEEASYSSMSIPPKLKIELADQRERIAGLEAKIARLEVQQAAEEEQNRPSKMRSPVPDKFYIERKAAKDFLKRFGQAIAQPKEYPLLFNVYGVGGVGKTTLLGRLQRDCPGAVDFLNVCFAKTSGLETPLKLMRQFHDRAIAQLALDTRTDPFAQRENQFSKALSKLTGEAANREDERKIRDWFDRFVWLEPAGFTTASPKTPRSFDASGSGFATPAAIGEDSESLKSWIQQRVRSHFDENSDERSLMLEPVAQLTRAFAESAIQLAAHRERSLVLVLDTYEKAQSYLNQWLWQRLVEDTPLCDAPVRLVVVGRQSLQQDEGWRKLNQDRKLLDEVQLHKFDREDTKTYLQQIGVEKGGDRAKIFNATKGLPYYLNWVRKQREKGEKLDFSKGNRAIAELLLQGTDKVETKILLAVACCRWFDEATIRALLDTDDLALQWPGGAEDCYEWLQSSDFVELNEGCDRLDDVARDVFRQLFFQRDRNQFRKTHAFLANYFRQVADEIVEPEALLPEPYEDDEWREAIAESLYHGLFKGREGLQQYVEQVFTAIFLRKPDVFTYPLALIDAEINEENQNLLPTTTSKFFEGSAIALGFGWIFLDKPPGSYKIEFEGENIPSKEGVEIFLKQIEASIQFLLGHVGDLKDGLGKCLGLVFEFLRSKRIRKTDLLLDAKSQAERISTRCDSKLMHHLFSEIGDLLYHTELYEDSLSCYQKVIEFDSNSVNTWSDRGAALNHLERYEEALDSYRKALEIDPKYVYAWYNQGVVLNHLERYKKALDSYRKVLEIDPKYVYAWNNQGAVLNHLERYEEALDSYRKALKIDSNSVDSWNNQGIVLNHLERYEEALDSYRKALKIDSNSVDSWNGQGWTLLSLRRYEEALAACDRAHELNPENSRTLNLQALALSLLKDFEKALSAIDKAIALNPEEALLKANRGIILARAGRYAEGLAACDRAIAQNSKNESGYYGKACCYALQGDIESAIENLQTAIEIKPRTSRKEAKANPDFDSIRDNDRFRALVYPNPES